MYKELGTEAFADYVIIACIKCNTMRGFQRDNDTLFFTRKKSHARTFSATSNKNGSSGGGKVPLAGSSQMTVCQGGA